MDTAEPMGGWKPPSVRNKLKRETLRNAVRSAKRADATVTKKASSEPPPTHTHTHTHTTCHTTCNAKACSCGAALLQRRKTMFFERVHAIKCVCILLHNAGAGCLRYMQSDIVPMCGHALV